MATFNRPGVYFEETLRPLSDTPADATESGAAFVGKAKGGPVGPTFVTSWFGFQSLFGSIAVETNDLAYAVYSFFANGGSGCYVVRAAASDATAATLSVFNGAGVATINEVFTVNAMAPGVWASDATSTSRVFVSFRQPPTVNGRFDMVIDVGNSTFLSASETFNDLSMDPADPRYAIDVVNSPTIGSQYVRLTRSVNIVANAIPGAATKTPLTGGSDGVAAVNHITATQLLESVDRNLVINVPGASSSDVSAIITWAEGTARHLIVADAPKPASGEMAAASVTAMTAFADALPNSSYVAVYGPWVYQVDPGSQAGATRLTAPGGAVVAQYLRTDAVRGVHKAPAGVATTLAGVVAPYVLYTNAQQDSLAVAQVNLLRVIPGSGVVIWGARTQSLASIDKYVPVRRLLILIKAALRERTRFAVFENIDDEMRELVADVVTRYLRSQYDLGALKGSTANEAFFVRCDETNNPQAVEDAGQIIIDVGVALKTPAEFIVIRIGQQQSGANTSDSLEEI